MRNTIVLVACAAVLFGCGKKEEAVVINVGASAIYKDLVTHFEVQYPQNWPKSVEAGKRVIFYSSSEASFRFQPPFTEGIKGAKMEVGAVRGGAEDMEKAIAEFKSEYAFAKFDADAAGTLGSGQGKKISYTIEAGDATMHAARVYAVSDSFVTYMETAWFSESETAAKPAFDQAASSIKIAHGLSAEAAAAASQEASAVLLAFNNEFFSIDYPDNFGAHNSKTAGMLSTATFRGDRNDCSFQVDVFDAKKLSLDKVFDQNKAKYPNAGSSAKTTIDGQPAIYLNYAPVKDVLSRVYFMVKGEKVYRVIMNWYKPQQEHFLGVFEKCVASLKAK